VLRKETEDFKARGFHSSFFLVDLPPFLPETEAKEMVARFEKHLRDQLAVFLRTDQSAPGAFPSAIKQHFRNLSHGSNKSGESDAKSLFEK